LANGIGVSALLQASIHEPSRRRYPKSAKRASICMSYQLHLFDDFHLHGASAPQWNQHYTQMTPGTMRSTLAEVTAGSVHVFRKWMSERVVQQGCIPADKICLGVLHTTGAGTPRMQGREVHADSLFILRGGEDFSLHRPRGMELLSVTFDADEFLRLLEQRPMSPPARALLSGSFVQAPSRFLQRLRRDALGTFPHSAAQTTLRAEFPQTAAAARIIFQAIHELLEHASGSRQSPASASASSGGALRSPWNESPHFAEQLPAGLGHYAGSLSAQCETRRSSQAAAGGGSGRSEHHPGGDELRLYALEPLQ
jgi:hypothetical protein